MLRFPVCLLAMLSCAQGQVGVQPAAEAANAYAFDTFQLFRQLTEGNFCYSPYSSHRLASLIAEGARGDTAAELLKLTHLPQDSTARVEQIQALNIALGASAGRDGLIWEEANSLWALPNTAFRPNFGRLAKERFNAAVTVLPTAEPVKAAMAVNAWVRDQTHNRVVQVVGPAMFQPGSVALVNTVYLKARWASAFDPQKTKPGDFALPAGGTAKQPFMHQSGAFNYADSESWQCLEMPLAAGAANVIFLLPRDSASQAKVESRLSQATWQSVTGALTNCDVKILMPRFSFSSELSMTSMWQFLGAKAVFENGKSDLSGMVDQPAFVREVMHQAKIEINETGAEAVAATAAIAAPFGGPPPSRRRSVSFIANRPFLWMITHKASGVVLFMGRFAGG